MLGPSSLNGQKFVSVIFFWPGMGLGKPFLVRLGTQILIYFGPFVIIFSVHWKYSAGSGHSKPMIFGPNVG